MVQQNPSAPPDAASGSVDTAVVLAAGDIARCGDQLSGAVATARLLDRLEGTILTLGDHAYEDGSQKSFTQCYEPTWGRHKARTRPAPGNHDYHTREARPYFEYFGENAGPAGRGYYSFDLASWHVVSLNSVTDAKRGSDQLAWLRDDLEANPRTCTLAYWHIPVFSSGDHGDDSKMLEVWRVLYQFGADVVLNGHDHDYERFGPQDPKGAADPARGIRQFVVGTGGAGVYKWGSDRRNSEVRDNSVYGVLKLTLAPASYEWEFVPAVGQFQDSGSAPCVEVQSMGNK